MGRARGLCFRRLFLSKGSSYFSVFQLPGGTGREPGSSSVVGRLRLKGRGFGDNPKAVQTPGPEDNRSCTLDQRWPYGHPAEPFQNLKNKQDNPNKVLN